MLLDAKNVALAKQFKPDLDVSKLDTEGIAWLKIIDNARGGGVVPVYDADITNGIASFGGVTKSKPLVSLKLNIPVTQEGSGTPSPDNVRPFVGRTKADIVRCGVNLWDEVAENGYISDATGANVGSNSNYKRSANYIICKPKTTYYFKRDGIAVVGKAYFYDVNKNYISFTGINSETTFTTPVNAYFMRFWCNYPTAYNNDISINYPSTDTDYHAYNGNTYTIPFGQTVYGDTLDVLTGELTVTHMFVNCTGANEFNRNNGFVAYRKTGLPQARGRLYAISNIISEFGSFSSSNMTKNIIQTPDSNTMYIALDEDVSIGSLDVLYELKTPITIQLTPTQIRTLIGENVIFADVGNITECKYTRK